MCVDYCTSGYMHTCLARSLVYMNFFLFIQGLNQTKPGNLLNPNWQAQQVYMVFELGKFTLQVRSPHSGLRSDDGPFWAESLFPYPEEPHYVPTMLPAEEPMDCPLLGYSRNLQVPRQATGGSSKLLNRCESGFDCWNLRDPTESGLLATPPRTLAWFAPLPPFRDQMSIRA